MTQDEIRGRKLREARETRNRLRSANQEQQVAGTKGKYRNCRIWFLLPRQSFIDDVTSADPLGLRALCLCVLCSNAIALHRL